MSEVAPFSEAAFAFLEEHLASPGSVQIRGLLRVSGSQFLDSVCEATSGLIGAVSFGNVVPAEFHLEVLAFPLFLALPRGLTFASLNGIIVAVSIPILELVFDVRLR